MGTLYEDQGVSRCCKPAACRVLARSSLRDDVDGFLCQSAGFCLRLVSGSADPSWLRTHIVALAFKSIPEFPRDWTRSVLTQSD